MTKQQLIENFSNLLSDIDFSDELMQQCHRILTSGGLDLTKYGNDYELPKIILTVALKNLAEDYMPFSKSGKEEVKNLGKF